MTSELPGAQAGCATGTVTAVNRDRGLVQVVDHVTRMALAAHWHSITTSTSSSSTQAATGQCQCGHLPPALRVRLATVTAVPA